MKTVISTPFPVPKETAAEFGVPKKRVHWLTGLMEAIREGRDVNVFDSPQPAAPSRRAMRKKVGGPRRRTRKR